MFIDYEAQRGYNLWTVKAYGQMLERTGFKQVAAIDKTNLMVNIMRMELKIELALVAGRLCFFKQAVTTRRTCKDDSY